MSREIAVPDYYDDLSCSLDVAWNLLSRGARDRTLMTHTPTVATIDAAGDPSVRTVVLRACDPATRVLLFNTDRRSAKHEHLRHHPVAALHVYEPAEKIQLRLRCAVSLHADDALAQERWASSAPSSRICYQVTPGPGTRLDQPAAATFDETASAGGAAHFVVVRAVVEQLEWLYLSAAGHRRARYSWPDNALQAEWLVP